MKFKRVLLIIFNDDMATAEPDADTFEEHTQTAVYQDDISG